jgi:hypothetical protein
LDPDRYGDGYPYGSGNGDSVTNIHRKCYGNSDFDVVAYLQRDPDFHRHGYRDPDLHENPDRYAHL